MIERRPEAAVTEAGWGLVIQRLRILALGCAINGCTAEESCPARGDCGANDVPAEVKGLPLSASTIYYYDIYASELAALSKPPKVDYCPEALKVASTIEASPYDSDPNIAADIVVVRNICSGANVTPEPVIPAITPTATP